VCYNSKSLSKGWKLMNWIEEEIETVDMGDKRLNKRLGNLLNILGQDHNRTIPTACNSWSETVAAYRFFDNQKVTPEKILSPHIEATQQRTAKQPVILHVQDTSEFNYSHRAELETLGPLSRPGEQGFHLHATLAVTPERVCLGVVNSHCWVRKELGKKATRSERPIEEKESFRWLESLRISNKIAEELPDTQIVNVADREGDIYELFIEANQERGVSKADWLIRAFQNRKLENTDLKLKESVLDLPLLGTAEFELARDAKSGRKARTVTQEIRAGKVTLSPPDRPDVKLPAVDVNIVYCKEINVPEGEDPIEWTLMTSVDITSREKALEIVQWYLCRWQIEIYFKILKSGCKIEKLQFEDFGRIEKCLSLYMILAWRTLYITMIGRACPKMRCDLVFSEEEWKAAYVVFTKKKPPNIAPSLEFILSIVGAFGGHLGRKHDGPPGVKCIWIGLQRIRDFALAWQIMQNSPELLSCV
jgi:hypothetical protein